MFYPRPKKSFYNKAIWICKSIIKGHAAWICLVTDGGNFPSKRFHVIRSISKSRRSIIQAKAFLKKKSKSDNAASSCADKEKIDELV